MLQNGWWNFDGAANKIFELFKTYITNNFINYIKLNTSDQKDTKEFCQ